jgi:hypothetical protein
MTSRRERTTKEEGNGEHPGAADSAHPPSESCLKDQVREMVVVSGREGIAFCILSAEVIAW